MNLHPVLLLALAVAVGAWRADGAEANDAGAAAARPSGIYNKFDSDLAIANAAGDSALIQQIALNAAQTDSNPVITVEKLSRSEAIKKFIAGKAGLLLLCGKPSAAERRTLTGAVILPYAVAPTLLVANHDNAITNIQTEMLRKIFSGEIASWQPLGISDYMIHLFGAGNASPGAGPLITHVLNGQPPTARIFVVSSSPEALELVSANRHALGFCGFVEFIPETVKLLSVDGVPPTESNILTGKYRLTNTYYACFKTGDRLARRFAETLRAPATGAALKSCGLIPKTQE